MNATEWFGAAWLAVMVGVDLWLNFTRRETVSQMMTRLGRRFWWVRLAYAAAVAFLYFHFWGG